MVSYAKMTEKERAEYSRKQKEEWEKKYGDKVDKDTLHWKSSEDRDAAVFTGNLYNTSCVRSRSSSPHVPRD